MKVVLDCILSLYFSLILEGTKKANVNAVPPPHSPHPQARIRDIRIYFRNTVCRELNVLLCERKTLACISSP